MLQDMHARDIRVAKKFRNALIISMFVSVMAALIGGFIVGATYAVHHAVINHTDGISTMENQSLRMQVHALTIERDAWMKSSKAAEIAKK